MLPGLIGEFVRRASLGLPLTVVISQTTKWKNTYVNGKRGYRNNFKVVIEQAKLQRQMWQGRKNSVEVT